MEEIKITNTKEAEEFIKVKLLEIETAAKDCTGIVYLSGGVDSAVVAVLGYRALGENLKVIFIDTGLMREAEAQWVRKTFERQGLTVSIVDASDRFFRALLGKIDPFNKRVAIRDTFYNKVLPYASQLYHAEFLLQGTNLTDIEATAENSVAPQHNILEQIGKKISLPLIEPLVQLRKPSIRQIAKTLGLPEEVWNRMPFPGPGLAARIDGEVNRENVTVIRKVTKIVETRLKDISAFQYFAILLSDHVPNYDRTKIGYAVAISCIDSKDATTAQPSEFDLNFIFNLRDRIYLEVPEVFRVCWDISTKPPGSVEWQ